jgi:hypothetical protein
MCVDVNRRATGKTLLTDLHRSLRWIGMRRGTELALPAAALVLVIARAALAQPPPAPASLEHRGTIDDPRDRSAVPAPPPPAPQLAADAPTLAAPPSVAAAAPARSPSLPAEPSFGLLFEVSHSFDRDVSGFGDAFSARARGGLPVRRALGAFTSVLAIDAHAGVTSGGDATYDAVGLAGLRFGHPELSLALTSGLGAGASGAGVPFAASIPVELAATTSDGRTGMTLWFRTSFVLAEDARQDGSANAPLGADELAIGALVHLPEIAGTGCYLGFSYREQVSASMLGVLVGVAG